MRREQKNPTRRTHEESEVKDLDNRIFLECPKQGESVVHWEQRLSSTNKAETVTQSNGVLTNTPFSSFPLSKKTLRGLKDSEFRFCSPIQRITIPYGLSGLDVLGEARTGSGKTLAFIIPVLENLYRARWSREDGIGALIVSPTRELASQIFTVLRTVGRFHDFSAGCLVGGRSFSEEQNAFSGLSIIVCTPGRLLQHLEESADYNISNLKLLVFDEADRLLDLGFKEALEKILDYIPPERQTLLFSATLRSSIHSLSKLALRPSPHIISPALPTDLGSSSSVFQLSAKLKQIAMIVPIEKKIDFIFSFVRSHSQKKMILFVSSCKQVRFLSEAFKRAKVGCAVLDLQGRQGLEKRMNVFATFTERKDSVCLISTDVSARGVDFPTVDWVIQMDAPENAEAYVHRVGRTARLNAAGSSLVFLLPEEKDRFFRNLEISKISPPRLMEAGNGRVVSIREKLRVFNSNDLEMKNVAVKSLVCYLRGLRLGGVQWTEDLAKRLADSLGLMQVPEEVMIALAKENTPQGCEKRKDLKNMNNSLRKLKEKIKLKKELKKKENLEVSNSIHQIEEKQKEDDWAAEMKRDIEDETANKRKSKEQRRLLKMKEIQNKKNTKEDQKDAQDDEDFLVQETEGENNKQYEVTGPEIAAQSALQKKRVKIRKDGTAYVRGAGLLGKTPQPITFNNEEEREDIVYEEEKLNSWGADFKKRLTESKSEDLKRQQERVKSKHQKIKGKLSRTKVDQDAAELSNAMNFSEGVDDDDYDLKGLEAAAMKALQNKRVKLS